MQRSLMFPRNTSNDEAELLLEPSPRLTGPQRLAIYQRSYYMRLLECLREQFPALCYALGAELFHDFAREYLHAYPSESHTLYELGNRFALFLEETRPDREAEEEDREHWIDFMVDLARFERQVFVMFDAPGHEGKPLAEENVPDEPLRLQPCFALGEYRFPVAWYYHEVRAQRQPPLPPQERSLVALVRRDYLTHTYPLAPPHYLFLATMKNEGKDVGEALECVARELAIPITAVRQSWSAATGIRRRWIAAGFFVAAE